MRTTCLLFVFLAAFLTPRTAPAQYYEPSEYEPLQVRFASIGAVKRTFDPLASNVLPDSERISFDRWVPTIGLRTGIVDLSFGYAKFRLQGLSRETVFFGAAVSQDIVLVGKRTAALIMPLMVAADFTKAEGTGKERTTFNIASTGIGGGLKYRSITPTLDFSLQVTELFHYSFEGLSTGSGFSAATIGDVLLVFPRALLLDGIAVGYRMRYQTWSMSEARFDYKSFYHGPYLAILF